MRHLSGILLALGLLPAPCSAATPLELYVAGRYAQAESAGAARGDAAGLALAARAELAQEMMRAEPCMPCLKRAEGFARRAIAAEPKLAESHIYLAISLGYEARVIGMLEARFKGFAEQAKAHIDAALADNPKSAWAWAALGGWNIEIVRSGGAIGRWLYGAHVSVGLADFAKAFAIAPDNPVLRFQYALTLAAYDRDAYREAIEAALTRAIAGRPQSAYDEYAQRSASALLAALKSGDWQTFDQLVRHDQGYPS